MHLTGITLVLEYNNLTSPVLGRLYHIQVGHATLLDAESIE